MNSLLFGFDIVKKFRSICLSIDEVIYGLVNNLFSVFNVLAETRLFSSKVITDFTTRIYIILSVVMLFALTYAIMTVIINPDKAASSDKSGFGIVKRVIIALIVLVFTPTVFDFGYSIQQSVIDNNVIGKVILGRTEGNTTEELKGEFVVGLFQGSFYITDKAGDLAQLEYADASLSAKINGDLSAYEDLLDYIDSGQVKYNNVISLIVGLFAVYCLVIFCFDLGVRCAKLAFFEMIAPVPALLYIVPGRESTFKSWTKEVLSTFFEVFVRVGIIYFITYAFYLLNLTLEDGSLFGELALPGSTIGFLVKLFIILGLLVFALRAPKLITDMLGIKSEGILSFKKRWDEAKHAVAVASTPARKVAGAGAGLIAADRAYRKGIKMGTADKKLGIKSFSAAFHGLRNGWRSGVSGMGNAYNYEMEMQRSYALNSDKSAFKQLVSATGDSLRDNFGFQSRYADKVREVQIERDKKVADALNDIRIINEQITGRESEVNKAHYSTLNANTNVSDKAKAFSDRLETVAAKENSKIFSSNAEMCIKKRAELDKDEAKADADFKKGDITKAEYDRKVDQIKKERDMITTAETYFAYAGTENDEFNNFALQKELSEMVKRDDLSQAEKNALTYLYKEGMDQNKVKYLSETPVEEQDAELRLTRDELERAVQSEYAGKYMDSKGTLQAKEDFKSMVADNSKIVKIAKKSGELVNQEKLEVNTQINKDPIEVALSDGVKREYQYSELQQIRTSRQSFAEEENKKAEKMKESYDALQQIQDARKKAADQVKPPKGGKGNKS